MKVFTVEHGELHEGGSVLSVHETRASATKAALKVRCCFEGGWILKEEGVWVNGCDFVQVKEMEVE